jgi:outer membrane protein OmpA-like peptidoglycan-associated protein
MTIRSSSISRLLALCALVLCTSASVARAQGRFDVETFEPAPAPSGSVLDVYGARTLPRRAYAVSVMGSYGRTPLSVESPSGDRLGDLVGSITTLQLLGAVGISERLDVGVGLPLHRAARGSRFASPPPAVAAAVLTDSTVALGDLRLVPRLRLYHQAADRGLGLALLVQLYLPTGDDDAYAGEPLRVEPRLALDYRAGRALVAFNAGYLVRQRAEVLGNHVDDQLRLGAGADVTLHGALGALVELDTQLDVMGESFGDNDVAMEALLGLRYRHERWLARLGGGPGIVRGPAAPAYRLFASVSFATERTRAPAAPPADRDGDLTPDARDRCPDEPEDRDGLLDGDGCADLDDDEDGVPDGQDACPKEREDRDGFLDGDGCADLDDDEDGVPDASDRCARVAGVASAQGCPAPEPAPPQAAPAAAEPTLPRTVYFRRNDVTLDARALATLDALARHLVAHPEIERLLVAGHTDSHGGEELNRALGERRARVVVNALVARGVARSRLAIESFGPSRPVSDNAREERRALNRRVELLELSPR